MTESSYHYNVIFRAMKIIEEAGGRELPLDELSEQMNMSPSHFQRLFSQWVGISPKRYQQHLQLDHARRLLRNNATTFETAHALGLSGTGRLHDLFIKWEAMSPGKFASRGSGVTIHWGQFDSPFGGMLAMGTGKGLCGIAFTHGCGRRAAYLDLRSRWPSAEFRHDPEAVRAWVDAALDQRGEARLHVIGAPFQIKIWEALLAIPAGSVSTYSDIARFAGVPKATRAAGTAIGRNPVSWLIPCHRAVRKSGELGGYHWGLPVKRAMLAWESARSEAAAPA